MNTSCKSAFAILLFVFFTLISFGQSKKEQILILSQRIDSLNQVLNQDRVNLQVQMQLLNKHSDSLRFVFSEQRIENRELEKRNKFIGRENEILQSKLDSVKLKNATIRNDLKVIHNEIGHLVEENIDLSERNELQVLNTNTIKVVVDSVQIKLKKRRVKIDSLHFENELQLNKIILLKSKYDSIALEINKILLKDKYNQFNKIFNYETIFVEGGVFQMGSNTGESDEQPVHSVTLNSFFIGKYEVTNVQWYGIMGNYTPGFNGCGECPVDQVSWNDAQEFIRKLNYRSGRDYRLPTEAEWEFSCRGGIRSKSFKYSGSNDISDVAWYWRNDRALKTFKVGSKKPNELGIYDMSGNSWELCSDIYGTYTNFSSVNPKGPITGDERVLRGGGYASLPADCLNTNRSSNGQDGRYGGFRLALSSIY